MSVQYAVELESLVPDVHAEDNDASTPGSVSIPRETKLQSRHDDEKRIPELPMYSPTETITTDGVNPPSYEQLYSLHYGEKYSKSLVVMSGNRVQQVVEAKPAVHAAFYRYLFMSVFVSLFCCLPLGILATFAATKALRLAREGDLEKAYQYSNGAQKLIAGGMIMGMAIIGLSIAYYR